MSNNVTTTSVAAHLALASYGDYDVGQLPEDFLTTLRSVGMSTSQARLLADVDADSPSDYGFDVVSTTIDNLSGFSATVFRSRNSGQFFFGVRGTDLSSSTPIESIQDVLSADFGDIGGDGLSVDQAIDMYNYYLRESAFEGASLLQFSHNDLTGEFSHSANVAQQTGSLAGNSFTVVGHSLGGHLGTVLSRLAPGAVDEVFTFNAPGFDPLGTAPGSESFYSALAQLEMAVNGSTAIQSAYDSVKLHHAIVSGDLISQLGDAKTDQASYFSATEQQGAFDAHGIVAFSDALAAYEILGRIDAGLDTKLDQAAQIFRAAANQGGGSIEKIVNAIGGLFPSVDFVPVADGDREALYSSLAVLKDTIPAAGSLSVQSLVDMSAEEIKANAQGQLAFRYALSEMNPFVVTGDDTIYFAHNESGELDLDQFSAQYLTDRATFLSTLMSRNLHDADVLHGQSQRSFVDLQRGESLTDIGDTYLPTSRTQHRYLFASDGDDASLAGDEAIDHIYGNGGSDVLFGGAGDDYLEGNRGSDQISGGVGRDVLHGDDGDDLLFATDPTNNDDNSIDRLFGGAGLDQYYIGDTDEITDSDRRAEIFLGSSQVGLSGTYHRVAESVYRDNDRNITIYLQEDSASVVAFGFEPVLRTRITNFSDPVNGFSNGDFGIFLDQHPPSVSSSPNVLVGSELVDDLSGSGADDYIEGLAGDDDLFGGSSFGPWGADRFLGGAGSDYMNSATLFDVGSLAQSAADQGDWMDGGDGDDIAVGNGGDDQQYGGAGRDFLSGRDGADVLSGGPGDDVLAGGGGDDLLIGGEGNDYLFSAFDVWASDARNWTAEPLLNAAGHLIDVSLGGVIIGPNPPPDDRDELHGGGGDDFLNGGNGDDTLFGEADADVLFGWRGHDVLVGGDGDDMLYGDTFGLTAGGGEGDDDLDGGRGNDELWGESGNDMLTGGDGDDFLSGGRGDDRLTGDDGADDVRGGDGADQMNGGAGDDKLDGGAGADVLNGDDGNDTLEGGAGHDFFTYRVGSGHDVLSDSGGYDLLFIDGVIDLAAVPVTEDYERLTFNFDANNSLTVMGWRDEGIDQIVGNGKTLLPGDFIGPDSYQMLSEWSDPRGDNVYFLSPADGAMLIDDHQGLDALVLGEGIAPSDVTGLVDSNDNWHGVVQGTALTVVGWGTTGLERFVFADGPELSYSEIDELSLHTPIVANPLSDQTALAGFGYSLDLGSRVFTDGNYEALAISAHGLPDWLSFDVQDEQFSGTPGFEDAGTYTITVTATDGDGLQATDSFRLKVSNNPFSGSAALDPQLLGGGNGSWFGSKPPTAPAFNFSFRHGIGSGAVGFRPPDADPELSETRTFEAVQGVGDLNGDGRDDLLITEKVSYLGPTRTTERVVFGRADGYGQYLDTSAALLRGQALELISSVGGFFTETGDFNNDGIGDLIITPKQKRGSG